MLPPGHIGFGYIVTEALLKFTHPELTHDQSNQLLLWGMFWAFAPDLDFFYAFVKEKALVVKDWKYNNHRDFVSHAPVLWLLAGLAVYFLSHDAYIKLVGLLIWLGSWSHFLMDSIEDGVMWLWPLSQKKFALRQVESMSVNKPEFWGYWVEFVKVYCTKKRVVFYLEVLVIISALIIYFR